MHVDSWECGSQNWSDSFAKEFRTRRGYDLLPYLPLLAGIPMESAGRSEEILRDVRTTIAELVVDVFYQVLSDCAKEYDCQFSAECVAPTMVSDGLLHYQKVDLPMGEFWLNSPTHDKPNDMLDAISGAHIYGKNIIQAEGFTEVRGTWDEYPAMLKTLLDRNYALGINRLFYHVYVHNPWLDRQPGMTLDGIGLFFQRNQTWWDKGAKAFSEYATRCQSLLQYGHPVTDIAVFTGEEVPRRSVLPERLVSSLPGLFGTERVESERIRLANEGQPLRVRPVGVTHSANMADPEKWVNPLRGYAYDSFNKDALLRLAKAENGRMKLAEGMGYKVVVLPLSRPMNPEPVLSPAVRKKMDELKAAGVIVPALPYTEEDFSAYGLERDMIVPEDVAWMHRSGELGDIYFVANQREETRTFTASMRINGRKPECWNPVTGEMNTHPSYRIHDNRTEVTLTLAPNESVFIVFPTEEAADKERTSTDKREPLNRTLETEEYTVTFLATGKTVVRKDLFDWSKEEDEQIAGMFLAVTVLLAGSPYIAEAAEIVKDMDGTAYAQDAAGFVYQIPKGATTKKGCSIYMYTGEKSTVTFPAKCNSYVVTNIGTNLGQLILTNLQTVKIPSGYTTIETQAFQNQTDLYQIEIPASVKTIGIDAFGFGPFVQFFDTHFTSKVLAKLEK